MTLPSSDHVSQTFEQGLKRKRSTAVATETVAVSVADLNLCM